MNPKPYKYLFFVTKPYSFSILEPIQEYINNIGGEVCWFVGSTAQNYPVPGKRLFSSAEVFKFNPDAVIVPGNIVPDFWPGLKVQIFHGLDDEPRGFYRITGFFDLYCTFGPSTTNRFNYLANKHRHFVVQETGWSKLDNLFTDSNENESIKRQLMEKFNLSSEKPIILYAPTFPPKYTSAPDLLSGFAKLKNAPYQILMKFHTLLDENVLKQYYALDNQNVTIVDDTNILPYLQLADVLITDTSSVAYEYLVLNKPIITYKSIARKDKGINILSKDELHGAIERSLIDPDEFEINRKHYLDEIHPFTDGKSASRVVDAISHILGSGIHKTLESKPKNYFRKWQIKKLITKWER